MKTWFGFLSVLLCCSAAIADDAVTELSKHLGKTPALVVVICGGNEGDLPTIAELVEQTPWTVFCQGPASPGLDKIRNWAREKEFLGGRVYVVDDNVESLWLASDMADAVWAAPGVDARPLRKEVLRVLHPGGVCIASGKISVKPALPGADEWRNAGQRKPPVSPECPASVPARSQRRKGHSEGRRVPSRGGWLCGGWGSRR